MSFVNVAPETVSSSAGDLDGIRSALSAANAAAEPPTTGIAPPAMDQVSAAITAALGTHALEYQAVSAAGGGLSCAVRGGVELQRGSVPGHRGRQRRAEFAQRRELAHAGAVGTLSGGGTGPRARSGHRESGVDGRWHSGRRHGGTGASRLPRAQHDQSIESGQADADRAAGLATGAASLASGSLAVPSEVSLGVDAAGPYLSHGVRAAKQQRGDQQRAVGRAPGGGRQCAPEHSRATP